MNIQKPYRYAGLKTRLKASAFDYLIIAGYIVLLAAITFTVVRISSLMGLSLDWPANPYLADLLAFVTLILPVIIYFSLQESSSKQATWGKKKAGIRVVTGDKERISRKQAVFRSILKFIPWQIAHTCIFQLRGSGAGNDGLSPIIIGGFVLVYLLAAFYLLSIHLSGNHTSPYDRITGTFVVINQAESYRPET